MYFSPEAVVDIDGLYYNVGGLLTHMPRAYLNRTALAENVTFDPSAFHVVSFQTGKPEAPFHYRPRRGAPEDIVWPPRGLRVDVQFKAPFWAPFYHKVTFHVLSDNFMDRSDLTLTIFSDKFYQDKFYQVLMATHLPTPEGQRAELP